MQRLASSYQIGNSQVLFYCVLFQLLIHQTACSQDTSNQQNLIPREILFSPIEVTEVKMAWNGEEIAYLKEGKLYHQSISPNSLPYLIPKSKNISEWYWTYSNSLVYIQDNNLYHFQNQQVDSLSFVNCRLLKIKGFSLKLPNQIVVELHLQDKNKNGLYLIYLDKSQSPEKIMDLQDFDDWYFDEDLNPKVATKPNYTEDHSLWYLDSLHTWKLIADYKWQSANYYYDINQVISLSPDGKELYFMDNQSTDKVVLKQLNLDIGEVNILYEDSLADLLWDATVIDNLIHKPLILQSFFGKAYYHFLEDSLKKDVEFLQKQQQGDIKIWNTSLDGRYWLVSFLNGYPQGYYRYDNMQQKLEFLFTSHPQINQYKLANRHSIIVQTQDSLLLPSWYFLPVDKDKNQDGIPDTPLPTIFYIHGGPWLGFTQNSWYINRNLQLLANRGYAVVYVEFRGSLGYGKTFTEASYQKWGTQMHQDVMAVVNTCIEKGISKEGKLAIFGWSYGGYAVFREMTLNPTTFVCGISMFGIANLLDFLEKQKFNPQLWKERVGDWETENGKSLLKNASPFYQLENIQSPLLITHGGKDQSIPNEQSDKMVEKLQNLKKEVTYIFYPHEPHNYRQDDSWISFWAIAEQFLQQHLDGDAQKPEEDIQRGNYRILVGKENIAGWDE